MGISCSKTCIVLVYSSIKTTITDILERITIGGRHEK